MSCTISQHDPHETDWDEMSEMMVTTKKMRVMYNIMIMIPILKGVVSYILNLISHLL